MFGKEILKLTAKKNKIPLDINGIINLLQDDSYKKEGFEVDTGKTDKEYEFLTWRFYFKKRRLIDG